MDKACSHVMCVECPWCAQSCIISSHSVVTEFLQAAQHWSWVRNKASGTRDKSHGQELKPKVPFTAPESLHRAGQTLRAAAHRRAHGFGRNQIQVLVIGDLIQTVAILKQLLAQIRMHL